MTKHKPTRYVDIPFAQRFSDALEYMTKHRPPEELVTAWLDNVEVPNDLQNWVGKYAPSWCQNIGVLDAAHVMADNPCEGEI